MYLPYVNYVGYLAGVTTLKQTSSLLAGELRQRFWHPSIQATHYGTVPLDTAADME
jgi:hypothetical protein